MVLNGALVAVAIRVPLISSLSRTLVPTQECPTPKQREGLASLALEKVNADSRCYHHFNNRVKWDNLHAQFFGGRVCKQVKPGGSLQSGDEAGSLDSQKRKLWGQEGDNCWSKQNRWSYILSMTLSLLFPGDQELFGGEGSQNIVLTTSPSFLCQAKNQ
ncbi:hypothetical protein Y1Q_0003237 [Alligator mississippiensis]|uniref:Uncharacterized protein n=1 Tax=Alligator mississippiensis TaxID=8496 RepID=A0A151ME22_ALLMI|nr:hypothetical protein Y1Q_0003237 [Alligator mississippiensis]